MSAERIVSEVPPEVLGRAYINMADKSENKIERLAWLGIAGKHLQEHGLTLGQVKSSLGEILSIASRSYQGGNGIEKNAIHFIFSSEILPKFTNSLRA